MTLDTWTIINNTCDAHTLGQFNSICAISNGYLGLSGNVLEERDGYCPVTIINGVYDELDMFGLIRASKHDRPWLDPEHFDTAGKSPAVANLPNPLFTRVFVDGEEVSLTRGRVHAFKQSLDLHNGAYHYSYVYDTASGRSVAIQMQRFASLVNPHRAFMRYVVTPHRTGAALRILCGISSATWSNMTRERAYDVVAQHAYGCARRQPEGRCVLEARTRARQITIHAGVASRCHPHGHEHALRSITAHDAVYTEYECHANDGTPVTIDRCVVLACSTDQRHGVSVTSEQELNEAAAQGFDAALAEHSAALTRLWDRADVQIEGEDLAQRNLRFCLYHLLAAAPRFTDRLSVPVKLLTGDYYQGNTFYDTDTYIVPFYTFTVPEQARTCLNWRCEGLGPGRAIARELGYAGAKLAWQAGPYGEECLGQWYHFVHTNIHINADVAYSLMQYYWATGDEAFMADRGIDILVESARFHASRAVYDSARGAYDILDVAGPDEAHCHSTNNFYTNYLAIRTLRWAADTLVRMRKISSGAAEAAGRRLNLRADEPGHWRHVADRLTLRLDAQTGVYEQCDGFYRLPAPPAELLENRRDWFVPLARYQALNQPDVVMAMVLFPDEFSVEVRRANWKYYKDKSMNFSSMSFAINAIMAAELGDVNEAYRHFMICAGVDLDEELTGRKDTHAGLHGTALGGAWMAAVCGFGGVHLTELGLRIDPHLPAQWKRIAFNLVLRGSQLRVNIDRESVMIELDADPTKAIPVSIAGKHLSLASKGQHTVRYAHA
jgi:trehalose/maltose hydrolase-like predicted phosphorylase